MEYVDKYLREVYYIASTVNDENIPLQLRQTLKRDFGKCMLIGSVFMASLRFGNQHNYYIFKDYLKAAITGSAFGMAYSPFYLAPKIDAQK